MKRNKLELGVIIVAIIFTILFCLLALGIGKAFAQDDEATALRLVQCIVAECDVGKRPSDERDAMAWALKKQAVDRGISLKRQIESYCAYANRHNTRARAIWDSTFESPLYPQRGNEQARKQWWADMYLWAMRFLAGEIEDPLDSSVKYFGGEMDVRKPGCKEVKRYCNPKRKKCNIFYRCGL
jgi:hypothetical protein